MSYQDLRNKYADKVKNYLKNVWKIEPSFHLCDVAAGVLMQRDGVIDHGGHFVNAVLDNDLRETFARADHEIQVNMKYVMACIVNLPHPVVYAAQPSYNMVDNE